MLCESGQVDPKATDGAGETPISYAVRYYLHHPKAVPGPYEPMVTTGVSETLFDPVTAERMREYEDQEMVLLLKDYAEPSKVPHRAKTAIIGIMQLAREFGKDSPDADQKAMGAFFNTHSGE